MDDRFNTIAGWVLFAGIVALGSSIVAGETFKSERPEEMGYPIEGVVQEGEGGAEAEKPIAFYLATADAAAGEQVFKKCTACHNADQGRRQRARPEPLRRHGRSRRQAHPGYAFTDALEGQGRQLGLGHDERLARQPEEVRAGHQDDLRRPQQSAGPRQRHGVPEFA